MKNKRNNPPSIDPTFSKETSLTEYSLQDNMIQEGEKKLHQGYYLLVQGKVGECYRNNKTIEASGYAVAETNQQKQATGKNLQRSTSTLYSKPCGSNCVMFQIMKYKSGLKDNEGDRISVRLNCTKTEYVIEDIVENSYSVKPKTDGGTK
jgi:hypothetical protein